MNTVLLAIGHIETEEILTKALNETGDYNVIGVVTYRGGILKSIEEMSPNIVVIRENIHGSENILDVIYEIRVQFPSVRIIFLADGDIDEESIIPKLVGFGIYDVLSGKKLKLYDMVDLIKVPRTLKDMSKYRISNLPYSYNIDPPKTEVVEDKKGFLNKFKGKTDKKIIKDAVEPFNHEIAEKEEILLNTEKEIGKLKNDISEKENKIKEYNSKIISLKKKKSSIEADVNKIKSNYEVLIQETDILENRKKEVNNEYVKRIDTKLEIEKEILTKKSEIESLEFQIKDLRAQGFTEEDKEKLEIKKLEIEKSIKTLTDEIEFIKKEIEDKSIKLKQCNVDYERYQNSNDSIEEEYERIKKGIFDLIEEKIKEKDGISSELTKGKEKLEIITEELKEINTEIMKVQKKYEKFVLERETNQKEKESLEESLEKVMKEIDSLKSGNRMLYSKLKDGNDVIFDLKNTISSVKEDETNISNNPKLSIFKKSIDNNKEDYFENKKVKINILDRASNRCMLVSFLGTKSGVGNTTVALNTAALLAEQYKVLYIETNDSDPYSNYLFELDNVNKGLDFALKYAVDGNTKDIYDHIVKSQNENVPENLSFLSFSQSYIIGERSEKIEPLSQFSLKTLIREIKADGKFDYVILDISDNNEIINALINGEMYTDLLYITLTQDIHSVDCTFYKKESMVKQNKDMLDSTFFIINKYSSNCKLKVRSIAEWIGVDIKKISTLTLDTAIFLNLSIDGKFYALQKGKSYNFSNIISNIMSIK